MPTPPDAQSVITKFSDLGVQLPPITVYLQEDGAAVYRFHVTANESVKRWTELHAVVAQSG